MALMKQIVTLEIVYDGNVTLVPSAWDWDDLLDFAYNASVKILDSTTPERVDNRPI